VRDATRITEADCPGELTPELAQLDRLVSTDVGLVSRVTRISAETDGFSIFSASMGLLEHTQPNIGSSTGRPSGVELGGGGGGTNARLARAVSIAEALERYSSCVIPTDLTWASANELGDRAIDVASLPQCSAAELAHPACPARPFDPDERIRWTTAWSLNRRSPVMVPAVSVWLHIPALTSSELFTMPISTGCATHTDIYQALCNAICEVIERDSIALTWLQRLALPRIVFDAPGAELANALDAVARNRVRVTFFDATSELGIPTLYSVDEAPDDDAVRYLVMCATDLDPERAAIKMLRESASSRIALATADAPPDTIDAFTSVFHGATYMSSPERSDAYDFLLRSSGGTRRMSELGVVGTGDSKADLALLLDRLDEHGMEAFAVEMTTREARSVGFRVVRVIIPQLMPLAFTHRARYLGHPRLYSGPVAQGFPAGDESTINPLPQPFA